MAAYVQRSMKILRWFIMEGSDYWVHVTWKQNQLLLGQVLLWSTNVALVSKAEEEQNMSQDSDSLQLFCSPKVKALKPISVAARSNSEVWGRSLTGNAGSKPAEGMDVCVLWLLCVAKWRSVRHTDPSSTGVLPSVVCLCVIPKLKKWGGLGPRGAVVSQKKKLDWKT